MLIDVKSLEDRLASVNAERESLIALISAARAYGQIVGNDGAHRDIKPSNAETIRSKVERAARSAPVMQATEQAVEEALDSLGPLPTGQLAELLMDNADLRLSAHTATNVLSARLSNSSKFTTRRGVGWWFSDRPWPNDVEAA